MAKKVFVSKFGFPFLVLIATLGLGIHQYVKAPKPGDTKTDCKTEETKKKIGIINHVKYWEEYTVCTEYYPKEVYGEDLEWHRVAEK